MLKRTSTSEDEAAGARGEQLGAPVSCTSYLLCARVSLSRGESSDLSSMVGRTLPRLTPREYEPGLLDAGGLPVRVRHIFDHYRQGAGLDETTGHVSSDHGATKTTSKPVANWRPDETLGTASSPPPQAGGSPLLAQRLQGKSSLQGAAPLPSSILLQQQQQQRSLSCRLRALAAGAAEFGVDMDGVGDDTPAPLIDVASGRLPSLLLVVPKGAALLVESYSGVVQSGQEQEFALVLLTRSLPVASLIVYVDGDITAKSFLVGRTLRATLPPLPPGRHSVSVGDTNGNIYRIQLGVSSKLSSRPPGTETEVLPLIALPYPASRRQPRLCYSTRRQRRGVDSGAPSTLPEGPFTAAELEAFVARTQKQLAACGGPSTLKTLAPFCSGPSREGPEGDSPQSFEERLKKCLQMAYGQRGPILRPADGVPPFVPDDLSDCRVPLAFKAALFSSCQATTRNAIAYFHSELFEFRPFGVVSAHIFTKSHPSDCITTFAFTLMPRDSEDRGMSPQSPPCRVACLDRFEVSERLCADTRHWKHIDTCVPAKNTEAATYTFGRGSAEQCPVPQCLRHAMNPFKDYPEGIEIGPYVYLYFEPWPVEVLPMPHPEPSASSSSSSNSGAGVGAKTAKGGAALIASQERVVGLVDLVLSVRSVAKDNLLSGLSGNERALRDDARSLNQSLQDQAAASQEGLTALLASIDALVNLTLIHQAAMDRRSAALRQAAAQMLHAHAHAARHLAHDESELLHETIELACTLMQLMAARGPFSSGSGGVSRYNSARHTGHQASKEVSHFRKKSRWGRGCFRRRETENLLYCCSEQTAMNGSSPKLRPVTRAPPSLPADGGPRMRGGPPIHQGSGRGPPLGPPASVHQLPQNGWGGVGPPGSPLPPPYSNWQYGVEQGGVGRPPWGPPPSSCACGGGGGGGSPPSSGGGLGASHLAYESELALVHFVVYLVCCIGCVCIYMNYVVLEAHIFALFWAVIFSIPLRAVVSGIAGGPRHRANTQVLPATTAAPPAAAAAAAGGAPHRPSQEQGVLLGQQQQADLRRAASANVAPPRLSKMQQQQQQQQQVTSQQQQGFHADIHHVSPRQRRSSNGGPSSTAGEAGARGEGAFVYSPRGPSGAPEATTGVRRRSLRIKCSTEAAGRQQQQQQQQKQQQQQQQEQQRPQRQQQRSASPSERPSPAKSAAGRRPEPQMQRVSSAPTSSSSSSLGVVHRNKKRRQREDSPEEELRLSSSTPSSSSSSSSRARLLDWVCQCVEGVVHFVWGSLSVRLSLSALSLLLLPLQELAGPLPDRSASKPWFGLLHRCCLLLLLQRLCLSSFSLQDLLNALGALLLLLLLLELLLLPLKGNRFLRVPLSWRSGWRRLRPGELVSGASMDSYVIPLVSVFVIVCFFLAGLLVTAFFCFNIYSELTTLWDSAHGVLDRYILRSDSFIEAYQKLSGLLQQQQEGLTGQTGQAAADVAVEPTPNSLAGFVAAAASAVRSSARNSSGGGSSAAILLGGSLGWYSDLWRIIQELASASNAANAAAAAAAAAPSSIQQADKSSPPLPVGPSLELVSSSAPDSPFVPANTTAVSTQQQQQQQEQQQQQQQQALTPYVSTWSRGSKGQLLLSGLDACPRLPSGLMLEDIEDEGSPSLACTREGGPLGGASLDDPSACEEAGSWWSSKEGPPSGSSGGSWGDGFEALLALLEDETTLSCVDPWRALPGGSGVVGPPSLGFQWAAKQRRRSGRAGGGAGSPRGAGSFVSFLFSSDLWKRWPNTAELLGHLREGNFLSALKQSLEASQEIYSLTSEAWWRYLSDHAHTLLAWIFNSGFGAWRVCCFVLAFLLRFFLSAFDLLFQFVVFVGALYALLCSPKSSLDLLEEVLCVVDPSAILSASVNEKIRAILFSSVKRVWFYSLFTWFIFESTAMPVVYVPTAVSCLLALLPLLPPETISILPAIALWLHQNPEEEGSPLEGASQSWDWGPFGAWGPWLAAPHRVAALCVCGANALVWWNVTTSIYREIPDASPWLVGLSAALGLSTLGLKGIILGPVLATMPLIVISAASKFNDRHIRTQEALGAPEGPQQQQPDPQQLAEQQLQPLRQAGALQGPPFADSHLYQQPMAEEVEEFISSPPVKGAPKSEPPVCWSDGATGVRAPSHVSWGPHWGSEDTGGFALGERRTAKRSNGWGPGGPPRSFVPLDEGASGQNRGGALIRSAPGQGSPPGDSGQGRPISPSSGSAGAPFPLPFGGPHESGPLGRGGAVGAPQQSPLALHFIKNAADAIRWVLQRRRLGVGGPPGAPFGGPTQLQYSWGPGAPLCGGPQQQMMLVPRSLSREAMQRPRKAMSRRPGLEAAGTPNKGHPILTSSPSLSAFAVCAAKQAAAAAEAAAAPVDPRVERSKASARPPVFEGSESTSVAAHRSRGRSRSAVGP
ncbi:hypothetical protein Esti_004605 [Eimeria stiedai]